jgi:hypothetical protein
MELAEQEVLVVMAELLVVLAILERKVIQVNLGILE